MTTPTEPDNQTPEAEATVERAALQLARDPVLKRMLDEERVESGGLDTALLGRLLTYLRPHKRLAAVAIVLATVEAIAMTLPAWLIGLAMDQVSGSRREGAAVDWLVGVGGRFADWMSPAAATQERLSAMVVFFGLLVGAVWLLRWGVAVTTTYLVQKLGQLVVHDLRTDVHRHLTGMDAQFFHTNPVGRLVNRTTFDVQALAELFSDTFAQGARDLLFILVLIVVMLALDLPLAAILLATFPVLVAIGLIYRRYARPALRTNSAVVSRMNAWMAENLAGMRENHLYRAEDRRRAEYRSLTDAHQSSITYVIRAWGLLRPAMMITSAVATSCVLLVGYNRVVGGLVTVGVLLTFLQYTVRLWVPVRSLTEKFNQIQTALTAGERVMDILNARSSIVDLKQADPALTVKRGRIRFDGVRFRYPRKELDVLAGVDFEVEPGQMLALVGDTGAGKSTIARLVTRQYDVTAGEVRVDGRDVRDYTLNQLRSGIAIVPQEVVIFAGSVRENITLGRDIPDERIWECVRAVRADTLIDRMSDGLDSPLEEGGRTLSTGERQLLSFARALVVNPPVLILDEATANVDTQTELLIQRALEALTAGRTSVVIAHRLSTIQDADQILVLRHGKVIERGTHDELLRMGGEYARLVELHHGGVAEAA
ncbi:MAG: hypothetical protein CMH57_05730 [Myxococcales bacterium]|nr:hypothetical protein [Myxococcales bacterium]